MSKQDGKIDMTFFTHDCFHFTIKGHEELAKGVWNNMVKAQNTVSQRPERGSDLILFCLSLCLPVSFSLTEGR